MFQRRGTTQADRVGGDSAGRSRRRGALLAAAAGIGTVSLVAGMLVLTVVPPVLGLRSDVVLSGSMRPALAPGDVVVSSPVQAGEVRAGDVVVVPDPARPGETLVHRVDGVGPDGSLVTRGDANAGADSTPVAPGDVLGRGRLRVPYVGVVSLWLQQGRVLPLAGAVLVVAVATWVTATAATSASAVPQRGRRVASPRPLGPTPGRGGIA
jgi:signal peptidase